MKKRDKEYVPKGLTRKERAAYIRRREQEKECKRQFDQDLAFCIRMETSKSFRNAWKATTYMACKERQ